MEEDEENRSHASPADSRSPDPSSPPVGQTTQVTVAAAAPPSSPPSPPASPLPRNASVVAIPAKGAASGGGKNSSGRASGGGREDCWSEGATEVLIDAWGERFMELSRGNLKQKHWKEVAEVVSSRENYGKTRKTDLQCKNRIDTVKKKYKQEKARMATGGGASKWMFFEKLDSLIGAAAKIHSGGGSSQKVPIGIPTSSRSNLYQRQAKTTPPALPAPPAPQQQEQQAAAKRSGESTRWRFRKRSTSETESESEPELSADSADSLPPPPKQVKIDKTEGGGGRECMELARAILRLGKAFEKAETAKLKQMVEMEKERMKFVKELELQRMEFFLKTQMEIARLSQNDSRKNGGGGLRNTSNDQSCKNNSDVSS